MTTPIYGMQPGITAEKTAEERAIWFGREEQNLYGDNHYIGAAAVDAANTPTTDLRSGLLMGKRTSDGNVYQYNPLGTDGTQYVHSILNESHSTLDIDNTTANKYGHFIRRGGLNPDELFILGVSFNSANGRWLARRQLAGRCFFADDVQGKYQNVHDEVVGANYTILTTDQMARFRTTASLTLTLPSITNGLGLRYEFYHMVASTLTVSSAEGGNLLGNAATNSNMILTGPGRNAVLEVMDVNGTLNWVFSGTSAGVTFS